MIVDSSSSWRDSVMGGRCSAGDDCREEGTVRVDAVETIGAMSRPEVVSSVVTSERECARLSEAENRPGRVVVLPPRSPNGEPGPEGDSGLAETP